jgi:HD superfamily phosphohydrolase
MTHDELVLAGLFHDVGHRSASDEDTISLRRQRGTANSTGIEVSKHPGAA